MKRNRFHATRRRSLIAICGLLVLVAAPVTATEVYRWVDEDGVVHFSQTAPAGDVEGVSRRTVENPAPTGFDPEQDLYDVAGQRERMQALREELDRKREARRERERQAPVPPPQSQSQTQGFPVYWGPGYRPPLRPRPPIEPPIEPPVRPEQPTLPLRPPGAGRS